MAQKSLKVVIAVDLSSNSDNCVRYYIDQVHRPGNKVIVLHVPEYWGDMARMMSPTRLEEVWKESQDTANKIGEKFSAVASQAGITDFEFVKEDGKQPWHVIIEVATAKNADLIVMGSRGMGTIRRTLVGSVSDGVVHHAHIPVLIVREQKK